MSILNTVVTAAKGEIDLTVDSAGFVRELPVAGKTLLRLRDYIEYGTHEPNAAGKAKGYNSALKCRMTFELLHKKHIQIVGDDKKEMPHEIDVHMNVGKTAKSGYKKMFNALNAACGGSAKNFYELIGKLAMATVVHSEPEKEGEKPKYANLDRKGQWTFEEPVKEDMDSGEKTALQCRELIGEPKIFIWEPTGEAFTDEVIQGMWDSIFREGTYTKGEGDAATEESLNFDQEKIMGATDWEGSRTQSIVADDEEISLDEEADDADLDNPVEDKPVTDDSLDDMEL